MAREPTTHLQVHAPVAERVIVPGDPGRALRLATDLVEAPKMVNHHRGLWGYTGPAGDGDLLTVQSTGLGGPSAAAIVDDLIALGARRLVRAGTCTALDGQLALGDVLVVDRALALDGTSRALGAGEALEPDPALRAALAGRGAVVASTDYGDHTHAGALARDMTTAAVFAAAARAGVPAAAVLLVATDAHGERLEVEALHAAELVLGRLAAAAMG
jgi:uridine phosphorylase